MSLGAAKREIDLTAERQRGAQPWELLGQSLRNMLLAVLFGLGFGGAAQRPGSELPFIVEGRLALFHWFEERQQKREARRLLKNESSPELDQMLTDLGLPPPDPTTSTPSEGIKHE